MLMSESTHSEEPAYTFDQGFVDGNLESFRRGDYEFRFNSLGNQDQRDNFDREYNLLTNLTWLYDEEAMLQHNEAGAEPNLEEVRRDILEASQQLFDLLLGRRPERATSLAKPGSAPESIKSILAELSTADTLDPSAFRDLSTYRPTTPLEATEVRAQRLLDFFRELSDRQQDGEEVSDGKVAEISEELRTVTEQLIEYQQPGQYWVCDIPEVQREIQTNPTYARYAEILDQVRKLEAQAQRYPEDPELTQRLANNSKVVKSMFEQEVRKLFPDRVPKPPEE